MLKVFSRVRVIEISEFLLSGSARSFPWGFPWSARSMGSSRVRGLMRVPVRHRQHRYSDLLVIRGFDDPEIAPDEHSRDMGPVLQHLKQAPVPRKRGRSSAVSFFNFGSLGSRAS